ITLRFTLGGISASGGVVRLSPAATLAGASLAGLLVVQRLSVIVRDAAATLLRQEAWVVISKRIMQKLPAVPYPLFENNAFQARYGLVIREASQRSTTLVDTLVSIAPIAFGLVALAITLLTLAPLLVVAILAIAIPAGIIERRFSDAMYELEERAAPGKLRMETLTNMQVDAPWQRDVRVYRSDVIAREHAALAEGYLAALKRVMARFLGLRGAAALVQGLGFAMALTAAYALLTHGSLTLVNIAVIIPGLSFLFGMTQSLIYQVRTLLESLRYTDALFEFLATDHFDDTEASVRGATAEPKAQGADNVGVAERASPPPAGALGPGRLAAIRLREVSYVYPENAKLALSSVSCELTPGLTAVVGTTGAGKTTLVKLLSGLVTPTSGALWAVSADGEEIPLATCTKAVLFQDPSHFHFSIRHNVTMRHERAPGEDERILDALRLAGLLEAVETLPDGMDTVVGAGFGGAADLSGGQWQRLALARLLYHDAPLIVLDEPSASVDPVGERQIFRLLAELSKEKIIVFTTHRYDTVRRADRIAVLVDGRLAELGTHEELVCQAGDFYALYLAQV
ncbi:MAG TPA: ABC transporter ATP-binding protein, partial [Ktedonobacterales bacterium]|nr:ABC transporter ATP-binding protein [Ktedonobacterales bacterium]